MVNLGFSFDVKINTIMDRFNHIKRPALAKILDGNTEIDLYRNSETKSSIARLDVLLLTSILSQPNIERDILMVILINLNIKKDILF